MSGGFLARWSRRKLASSVAAAVPPRPAAAAACPLDAQAAGAAGAPAAAGETRGDAQAQDATATEATLPPVSELTLASDFTAFLKEEVSEALRRQALQKLFADPHFNRMDGLDVYIDDYNIADPIPPAMMEKLKHAREWLGDATADAGAEAASGAESARAPVSSVPPPEVGVLEGQPAAGASAALPPAGTQPAEAPAAPAASPPAGGTL